MMVIIQQAWSPATSGSSVGLIAFTVMTPTHTKIYTIPSTGGTPTLVVSSSRTSPTDRRIAPNSLTWCNGGSNIAYVVNDNTSTVNDAIKIVDIDGTEIATLHEGSIDIRSLRGSTGSTNSLLVITYESAYKLSVIGTVAGSTPTFLTTVLNTGSFEWSPDNTEAIVNIPNSGTNRINVSTGAATQVSSGATIKYGDWK